MKPYIRSFFKELEVYEDIVSKGAGKQSIENAIYSFLEKCDGNGAIQVYKAFFEMYWIGKALHPNPYIALVELLKQHEISSEKLLYKHRDHLIHSVHVFLIGICIFIRNTKYRTIFEQSSKYRDSYTTRYEEFFYRWGIASLFHDIAYPIEIELARLKRYLCYLWDYPLDLESKPIIHCTIAGLGEFFKLPKIKPNLRRNSRYPLNYYPLNGVGSVIDLLSHRLSELFEINRKKVSSSLIAYKRDMSKSGCFDHAFFSAALMLKWYHSLVCYSGWNPAYFYNAILDASTAVLLHTFYKKVLMNSPFKLKQLSAIKHPLSYLLIVCDEIQEWDRSEYGVIRELNSPITARITVNEETLKVVYKFKNPNRTSYFIKRISNNLSKIINFADTFKSVKIEAIK
jgi:hypothetical protein